MGVTNDLKRRIGEHKNNRGKNETFAGKYFCYKLIYYETFDSPIKAIRREKELKKLTRADKINLIISKNPDFDFYSV